MGRTIQGLTLTELTAELESRTRAIAILKWLHGQPSVATTLPSSVDGVSHRVLGPFSRRHALTVGHVTSRVASCDGTTKYAITFEGTSVETVRIPARGRSTICISSQAGCTRKCAFCATKELGFIRQLTAQEMVTQFMIASAEAPPDSPATNVVFMGMGEPMDNLDEVLRAVEILTQTPAPQLRMSSITVSTSGVVPGMKRFLESSRAGLALSLNATTDEVRAAIMPQTRTWPIAALLDVLRAEAVRSPKRDTFVEYVLFEGVNDSDADADRLVAMFRCLPARINLIPYNPYPGTALRTPTPERIRAFHARVVSGGQLCLVRWPRGRDVAAACGQLVLARGGPGFASNAL